LNQLPDEDGTEFAALEAALVEELAPVGALQTELARRGAVAAWRLARADQIEVELFEERRTTSGGLGLALLGRRVRPRRVVGEWGPTPFRPATGPQPRSGGQGTAMARARSRRLAGASTDLGGRRAPSNRYRGAAMAEFSRALRTLKALQAEQALKAEEALLVEQAAATGPALRVPLVRTAPRLADRAQPNEPERALPRREYVLSEPPAPGALHAPAAPWRPNEPEGGAVRHAASMTASPRNPEPQRSPTRP
jgi:hypothetical protein